jgi:hypothetical protein
LIQVDNLLVQWWERKAIYQMQTVSATPRISGAVDRQHPERVLPTLWTRLVGRHYEISYAESLFHLAFEAGALTDRFGSQMMLNRRITHRA